MDFFGILIINLRLKFKYRLEKWHKSGSIPSIISCIRPNWNSNIKYLFLNFCFLIFQFIFWLILTVIEVPHHKGSCNFLQFPTVRICWEMSGMSGYVGKCLDMSGYVRKCRDMWGNVGIGICEEMSGNVRKCREMLGNVSVTVRLVEKIKSTFRST